MTFSEAMREALRTCPPGPALRFATWCAAAVLLVACTPSTTIEHTAAYRGTPYTGRISGMAVVMGQPDSDYRTLGDSAYDHVLRTAMRHPYVRPRYDLIERSEIDRILDEHDLGATGFVDRSTAPRVGQLVGAEYVLIADLVNADVRNAGVEGLNVGDTSLGFGAATVAVALSTRLVDVTTGRVLATGYGEVTGTMMTGLSIDGTGISSPATRAAVVDLFPEAAIRSLNALFRSLG